MAEYCLDCWNEINETALTKGQVRLSQYPELCEGCGEMQPAVEALRPAYALMERVHSLRKEKWPSPLKEHQNGGR